MCKIKRKRKSNKIHGGMWEATDGLVISGENSIQGIKRELQEEIGLNVPDNELLFNDGEVINAQYVTIEKLLYMIEQRESFE